MNLPDPETPVGARGVGEPPVGAGYGAVMNAIADAVGVDVFRRAPVTADIVLMSLEHGRGCTSRCRHMFEMRTTKFTGKVMENERSVLARTKCRAFVFEPGEHRWPSSAT